MVLGLGYTAAVVQKDRMGNRAAIHDTLIAALERSYTEKSPTSGSSLGQVE